MGTNYYYHVNVCEHCKKSDRAFHIGKSSAGWTFSFQSYLGHESPFIYDVFGYIDTDDNTPVSSFSDWKKVFNVVPGEIRDEYGEVYSVNDFIEIVDFKRNEQYNHTQVLIDAKNGNTEAQKLWGDSFPFSPLADTFLDLEGHSFQYGEFC